MNTKCRSFSVQTGHSSNCSMCVCVRDLCSCVAFCRQVYKCSRAKSRKADLNLKWVSVCVQCAELHLSLCLNLYPPYPHARFSVWINQVWKPVTKPTSTTDIPTVYTAIPFQVSSFLRGLLLCLICLSWTFPFKIMPSLTVVSCLF